MAEEFEKRVYSYVIRLIKFLNGLPRDAVTREIISQLMRSGTSIGANFFEAKSASFKKDYQNYFNHSVNSPPLLKAGMRAKSRNEASGQSLAPTALETVSSTPVKAWESNVLLNSNLVPSQLISECQWLLKETGDSQKFLRPVY